MLQETFGSLVMKKSKIVKDSSVLMNELKRWLSEDSGARYYICLTCILYLIGPGNVIFVGERSQNFEK